MGLISWWQERKKKELQRVYNELSAEFFETYNKLKQEFYELKEYISRRLDKEEVLTKREHFYETYRKFLGILEKLISIDNRWQGIDSKMGYLFGRGVTYLMKYSDNFDYDKALNTLNMMKPKLKEIESLLSNLKLREAA